MSGGPPPVLHPPASEHRELTGLVPEQSIPGNYSAACSVSEHVSLG